MQLNQILLSAMPSKVQCSNEKRCNYKKNIPKTLALNYKFIQLSNDRYTKFISIDIDGVYNKSISDMISYVMEQGLPVPTIIAKTDKGFHLHWYLYNSVFKNNYKDMNKYKQVTDRFNLLLGGDSHFARFIVRNPLKHEHFYSGVFYDSIDDFKEFYKEIEIKPKKKQQYTFRKQIDWSSVVIGERNQVLYNYIRTFMFNNWTKCTLDGFIDEALNCNSKISEPLNDSEVVETVKSVYNWVSKVYNPNYTSEFKINYNRKLAKQKQEKTLNKIKTNLVLLYKSGMLSVLKLLSGRYTIYGLSKLLKVDRKTVKKYIELIKQWVKELGLILKRTVGVNFDKLLDTLIEPFEFIVGQQKINYRYILYERQLE